MKQVQNCFGYILKCYTFENVTSVLAVVYVLLGRRLQNTGEVEVVLLLLCVMNFWL